MSNRDHNQEENAARRAALHRPRHRNIANSQGHRHSHAPENSSSVSYPDHSERGHHESLRDRFQHFAHATSNAVGSVWAFLLALLIVIVWGFTGPIFGYSDTWQLVINTGTTIVTFVMVFLIQSTQNRDARAMHLKLDELIRAIHGARNDLMNLEDLPEEDLDALAAQFASMHKRVTEEVEKRQEE